MQKIRKPDTKGRSPFPREKRYVCIFCGMIFAQFTEIDQHFLNYHRLDNYRECCYDK